MAAHLVYPDIAYDGLLAQAAERWPDKTAIIFQDRRISYADWDAGASRFATFLVNAGVEKGDRVALFTPNCPEYEIAFFGAARAGAVPTPLNPAYKEREVRHQLNDSGARVLVVHAALLPMVEAVRSELPDLELILVVGDDAAGAASFDRAISSSIDRAPDAELTRDDLAALPYSSGTTGLSKGVMLSQGNLVSNAYQFVYGTRTTEADVILIFLPLYHIYGVALMSTAVAGGATQVLMERFDLAEVARLIRQEHATELFVVPPVMLALANSPDLVPGDFRSLRFIKSAAAPLAPDVARRVADRLGVPVIQAYGMTETSPLTHMVDLDRWREVLGTVGVVVPDTECRVVDIETGERELPAGELGEVVVRGPQVMLGYWQAPGETERTLRNGWIHMGDIGSVDAGGNLSIIDRKKEMIKYKAFSIAPAELEAILLEHPDVVDCGVTSRPDAEAGEVPCAYVVLRPDATATPDELLAFVADRVATFKQIRRLEIVDAIPRTPSGKILRRVLKERAAAEV